MQLPDLSRLTQDEKNALILVLWGQVQTLTAQVAVLHGPGVRAQLPPPRLWSGGADGNRASELQHAVEGMDGDVHGSVKNLGQPACPSRTDRPG